MNKFSMKIPGIMKTEYIRILIFYCPKHLIYTKEKNRKNAICYIAAS